MEGRPIESTTRSIPSTRYWVFLAAYVVLLPPITGVTIYAAVSGGSEVTALVFPLTIGLLALLLGAPIALFKDSIHLREVKENWQPKWWRYLGGVFGIPLVGGMSSRIVGVEVEAWVIGVSIFVVTMWAGAAHYIYRRHQRIGVP